MKKLLTLFAIFTILSMFVTVNAQTPGGVNVPQGGTGLVSIPQYGWLSGGGAGSPLRLISSTSPTVGWLTSTSTTISSIFPLANITKLSNLTSNGFVKTSGADGTLSVDTNSYLTGSGAGVTAVSVASSNGFAGSSSGGATPALTLSTTITGLLKGNGTAISAAANGTDYTLLTSTTCGAGAHISAVTSAGAVTCSSDSGGGGGGTGVGWLWNSINSLYQSTTTDDVLLGASATTSTAKLEVIAGGTKPSAYFKGNVGVGTTSPYTMLAVAGEIVGKSFTATTTTATSTFAGNIVIGNGYPTPYLNGLYSTPTQVQLTNSVSDLTSNLVIGNTDTSAVATGGITLINARSTGGLNGTYYGYLGFSGPNFAAFTGLPPNTVILRSTDGPIVFGATSANVASSSMAWAIGSGYAVANYDMVLKNVDTLGSTDTASGGLGLGTTTPDARLTLLASSTATFDYLNVYQHVNGVTTGIPVFNVNKNENVGIASTTPWGRLAINPNGISGPAFVIGSSTGTKLIVDNGGKVGIGTTTPVSTLNVRGSFHVEEQNIATSTSMSVDFCSPNTSNFLRGGPSSSNITFTWTNYETCPGKRIFVEWFNPSSGLIGSTTFTAAKLHWNGYIDPGSNVNLGGIDTLVFTSKMGSSTPYIEADIVSTLP